MILDVGDQIANAYAPTSTGTTTSGTYIDRLIPMDDGSGNQIYWYLIVGTAAASSGSATVAFNLIGNPSDPTFASGNVTVLSVAAQIYTNLVANFIITRQVIPRNATSGTANQTSLEPTGNMLRYWTLQVVIATAALTGGTFSSWLTPEPLQDNLSYKAGYTV